MSAVMILTRAEIIVMLLNYQDCGGSLKIILDQNLPSMNDGES